MGRQEDGSVLWSHLNTKIHLQEILVIPSSSFLFHFTEINPGFLYPGCSTTQITDFCLDVFGVHYLQKK